MMVERNKSPPEHARSTSAPPIRINSLRGVTSVSASNADDLSITYRNSYISMNKQPVYPVSNEAQGDIESFSPNSKTVEGVKNPFAMLDGDKGGPPMSYYEWFKIIVTGPFVVALRAALLVPTFFLVWAAAKVAVAGAAVSSERRALPPLAAWRRYPLLVCRAMVRVALFIMGYYWIKLKRPPGPWKEAPVIVCNHVCVMDSLIVTWLYGVSPVGIEDTLHTPIFGAVSQALQMVYINRFSKDSRQYALDEIKRRATPGSGFPPLIIFPEGTTKDTNCLIKFKHGAFTPGQPVRPVIIRYPWKHFNPAWLNSARRQLRIFVQYVNHVSVEELPVYMPNAAEQAKPDLFAQNVRNTMANAMGVPVSEHTLQDMVLFLDANLMNINMGEMVFEKLKRANSRASLGQTRNLMKVFKSIDKDGDGKVSFEEFCSALEFSSGDSFARTLFDMMDEDHSGGLDYNEFLFGVNLLMMSCKNEEDFVTASFSFFDANGDGLVSLEEAQEAQGRLDHMLAEFVPEDERQARKEFLISTFRGVDSDNDGQITRQEFSLFFRRMRDGSDAQLPSLMKDASKNTGVKG